jgi:tetratricopeptide (TPR) repeat protein
MGNWCPRSLIGLVLLAQGVSLFAGEAEWKRQMDAALQSAARKDYAGSETAFSAAIKELEMTNPNDPRLGPTINSLGLVYRAENKLPQAEAAFRRAMVYIGKTNPPGGIDVGNSNLNVGSALLSEGKYNLAEPFLQKAYRIYEKQLGERSPKTATVMAQLGEMYRNLHDYAQAEPILTKALDIQEAALGIDNADVGTTLNSLAEIYSAQNLNEKAEPRFKLVMSIRESTVGMESPEFVAAVERYAAILEKMGRYQEAARHKKLAAAIRNMKKGPASGPADAQQNKGSVAKSPAVARLH